MGKHTYKIILLAGAMVFANPAMAASVKAFPSNQGGAQEAAVNRIAAAQTLHPTSPFSIFTPKRQTRSSTIDYSVWDAALQNVVLRLGQSIRVRAKRPNPIVGTRMITGHRSAYRLEGSRVMFSHLTPEYKAELTAYRKDLERIANNVDITALAKKEQLAFWFNLHNVALIEQIALHYPVRQPEKLRIGPNNELLNEAKILNIRGVPMSLRDIREKIVYPNWSNPDVMYGFFRGNIGGPALQNYAFTSRNVDEIIKLQAWDFVNSLRGFHESRKARKVSTLYEEVRPFYFKNWPDDLIAHLRKHAEPDVLKELASDKPVEFDRYDPVVADLNGGDRPRTANLNVVLNGQRLGAKVSPETLRLLQELDNKTKIMRRRGMIGKRKGVVTIEDIPTVDIDLGDDYNDETTNLETPSK